MENLIKQIERYQIDHKLKYDTAMAKPFNEIVHDFAGIIGAYQSQLEIIKIEIQCNKYTELKKEHEELKKASMELIEQRYELALTIDKLNNRINKIKNK